MKAGLLILLCGASPAAAANFDGGAFADDFESGTLHTTDVPPGQWDQVRVAANNTVTATPLAAHRGAFGLRIADNSTLSGYQQGYVQAGPQPNVPAYYWRMWIRLSAPLTGNDNMSVLGSGSNTPNGVMAVFFNFGFFTLAGYDRNAAYRFFICPGDVNDGAWHLVEAAVTGLNTDAGERQGWFDGVLEKADPAIDWTGTSISTFSVGEPYTDNGGWVGNVDIDDVRTSTRPMASTLIVSAPSLPQPVGACVPLRVTLVDSITGASAPAPYAFDAGVTLDGGSGAFYADGTCSSPASGVAFPSLGSSAAIYLMPGSVGTLQVSASYVDFVAGPGATLTVIDAGAGVPDGGGAADGGGVADGGTSTPGGARGPVRDRVGCGCGANAGAGAIGLVAALAAIALTPRGRSSRPRRGTR